MTGNDGGTMRSERVRGNDGGAMREQWGNDGEQQGNNGGTTRNKG